MNPKIAVLAGCFLAGAAAAPVRGGQDAPPPSFDPKADARAELREARTKAEQKNKRVLVVWGTSDHAASEELDGLLRTDRVLGRKLLYEYETVRVDVGADGTRNAELAAELGAATAPSALPSVTLLSFEAEVLANHTATALTRNGAIASAPLLELLKEHEAEPLVAREQLAAGLAEAKAAGKHLFLGFDAPW